MKLLTYLGVITMVVISLSSCKKGDNDPALSLRTRKARLTGEWEMTSMSYTNAGSYTATGALSNGTKTETNDFGGTMVSYSYPYTMNIEFLKDGSFVGTETADGDVTKYEGIWAFLCGSKEAELKKKEAVVLTYTKITYSDGSNETINAQSYPQDIWILDQLSNKKIVTTYLNNVSSTNFFSGVQVGSTTNNYNLTQTFEKK